VTSCMRNLTTSRLTDFATSWSEGVPVEEAAKTVSPVADVLSPVVGGTGFVGHASTSSHQRRL
jgi:hypothetical protein